MLKVRIITTMLWNGSTLVKGNKFENEKRSAGSPLTTVKIYDSRDVDEILFFDISRNNKRIDKDFILSITDCVSVPITIGGGIEKISQMNDLFEYGADKIAINSIIFKNPNIIDEASKRFGSQAITVSIDVRKINQNYECYYDLGKIYHSLIITHKKIREKQFHVDYTDELAFYSFSKRRNLMQYLDHFEQFILENGYKNIEIIETYWSPTIHSFLRKNYGKTQVPLLLIDNSPLYESSDIIKYLEEHKNEFSK